MSAIEKINSEMQKSPNNTYIEIIGQYVIDRCAAPACDEAVAVEGKTLSEAMKLVESAAKKQKQGSVAVLSPSEVFGIIDKYFGIPTNESAQLKAIGIDVAPKPANNVLNLSDFL